MADEKINSTANNIQIDVDNLSYVDYLWTQRTSDTAIQGVRLDQRNLPLNLNADTVDNKHASDFALASHTHNYAGSDSAGGAANSVKGALTFGAKAYNGSTSQEITLSDLGGNIINCYNTSPTDTAGTWTVSIPNITELTEGLTIKIRLKTSYNGTKNTLNVNGLGAKTIYFKYGNKLTSHYAKESVLALTYTSDAISSGNDKSGWIIENIYDSTNTYQLRKYYSRYTTKSVLYRYMICFVNKDNLLVPANNVSNSTSTNKTLTGDSFDLSKGIYYYNSTTTVAAGSLTPTSTLYQQIGLVNLQYSFNTGKTLTANKPVYLVVTPLGEHGEVILASTPIAQALPTTNDGNRYVFLGYAYDNYRIELTLDHTIYVYNSINRCYTSEISNLESNKVSKNGDTMNGNLNPSTTKGASLGTSSLYWNDIYGTTIYEGGTSLVNKYLGKTAKAADADKLDGNDSTYYLNLDNINDGSTRKLANYVPKSLISAKGDMIYASGASAPERLGIGSNGQFLSIANGVPKWVNNPNSDTHYTNFLQIKGNGTEAVKFTQNANKSLNLKPGNNVSISAASDEITISATVPTKSSWNYDDTYVKYSAVQRLTDIEKTRARINIGAGTSSLTLGTTSSTAYAGNLGQANANDIANILDGNSVVGKAESDGNGNNIVNTYATKSVLNTTNSNVTTLQGYFSSGIAKKATAAKNGKDITTEYVHTRVDGGTSSDQIFSQIKHMTDDSVASVYISADNTATYYGGNVWVTTDFVQLYYGDGTQDSCRFELMQTGATLEFDGSGTKYPIITTKDTATASNAGIMKAAAVRTTAITTTQGGTTDGRFYGVELDKNGKAFVNVPWTDNNTTYSAGKGLSLSGTTFSANTSLGLINSSSANVFDIYRLNSSSYRLKIIRGSHTFSFSSATGFPGGSITFPSGASMPSSNYHVIAWSSAQGNVDVYQIKTFSKETTGFQIVTRSYSSTKSFSVEYLAICTV